MSLDTILYRPSWQKLRVSCLTDYNPYGGMTNPVGAQDAINRIFNYIGDVDLQLEYVNEEIVRMNLTYDEERAGRIYRGYNFLMSTANGLDSYPNLTHVKGIRDASLELERNLNHSLVSKYASKWNWDAVKMELELIWIGERYWFTSIQTDIKERIVEKDKRSYDMFNFFNMMQAINRIS